MTLDNSSKGKKREHQETLPNECLWSTPPSVKKSKRAETRQCPICSEHIPVRLLPAHCDLEAERVEEIIRAVGSVDIIADSEDGVQFSRARRSAARARKAFTSGSTDTMDQTEKIIRAMKRRRKHRHNRLREMIRDDDEFAAVMERFTGSTCPMCLTTIQGDLDVVEAHVDSCLLHAARIQDEQARANNNPWIDENGGPSTVRVTDGVDLTASGFHVRNQDQQDVEDEVDVDGDDEDTFGHAQFTEIDVLSGTFSKSAEEPSVDDDIDIDGFGGDSSQGTTNLQGLIGTVKDINKNLEKTPDSVETTGEQSTGIDDLDETNTAIINAQQQGDGTALIQALEDKVKLLESIRGTSTSSLCRICLDPYTEPTVSTQCWHTCCRECWLRCLSTRLCPICKRITSAENLRRIYL